MNREHVMAVLYDLALVIGGEVRVRPLLTRTLQRLLYHTSFPTGLVFLDLPADEGDFSLIARLDAAVGDFELAERVGGELTMPAALLRGPAELGENAGALLEALPCSREPYNTFLRLPIDGHGVILLLAPRTPHTELPLTQVFQPVLANLDKAILLCRHSEAYAAALERECDRARAALGQSQASLQRALLGTIQAMALMAEKRDPYTAGHQQKVSQLAAAIARELGWPAERIEGLRLGAMIHDIGKIYVPAEILNRPGALSAVELALIRTHPEVGYDILKDIEFPWPVAQMVVQHHERLDGSGYPRGLRGDEIVDEARVLAVADVVESMSSHRPYRPALGVAAALAEIEAGRSRLYDRAAVDACLRLHRERGFRFV